MTSEINNDFFCTGGSVGGACPVENPNCPLGGSHFIKGCDITHCYCYCHKHPTPEQFKEEYGEEYHDHRWVWVFEDGDWRGHTYFAAKHHGHTDKQMVCMCTPYGEPPVDWRPE